MNTDTPIDPNVRQVFFISDGTGITAETFSNSLLAQFEPEVSFKKTRIPFVDSLDKAAQMAERIDQVYQQHGIKPIVFSTLVNPEINARVKHANAIYFDLFTTYMEPLEREFNVKSSHSIGRSHTNVDTEGYRNRIEAINFSLAHDDGQLVRGLEQADVILIGVSRCGKTPTSLYLAMQYGIKAANVPLIPEDFERDVLPSNLTRYKDKIFGLTILPERLAEVRFERRPNSQYATLEQCRYEVAAAERLMRMEGIRWLSSTTKSIEEIATTIMHDINLESKI